MSKFPYPENTSQSSANKGFWLKLLRICGTGIGGILLIALTLGAWRLRSFIENELAPLAEQNLKTTLKRPIELGKVKEFSLTGVKFAASAIPATAEDPDRVTIDAVEVGFDPLQLLFNRTLKLDVTLVNPNVYVEQDAQGQWVTTSLPQPGPPGAIKTQLEKIRLSNATLLLIPYSPKVKSQESKTSSPLPLPPSPPPSSLTYTQLNGTVELLENNTKIRVNAEGEGGSGGNIALKVEALTKTQEFNLEVKAKDLLAADVTHIVPLPVKLEAGKVDGDLKVQFKPKKFPLVFGSATAKAVQLQIPRVPLPFRNSQGNLSFQGTTITLENISSNYGKIPLIAKGKIDKDAGYNLAARIDRVSAANALETLKVKSPLPTSGEFKADLQVTGLINKPILSGNVASIQGAKVDKVDIEKVSTKFIFAPVASLITFKNIQAKPKLGGDITGGGTVSIGKNARIDINYNAKNIPGDAYAALYEANAGIDINKVSATGQLTGPVSNVQTIVNFQAPQATYPARGQVNIAADRTVTFRNIALNIAGGNVLANGSWAKGQWQTVLQASKVAIKPFVSGSQQSKVKSPESLISSSSPSDSNPPSSLDSVNLDGVNFNGRLILSGTTGPFKVAKIQTQGASVGIGGGTVAVSDIDFAQNNDPINGGQKFSAKLIANGVRLSRVLKAPLPSVMQNPLSGTFQIAGDTNNFSLNTIVGIGEGQLAVGNGSVSAKNIQLANGAYTAKLVANKLPIKQIAQVPERFQGAFTGQLDVAGSVDSFNLRNIKAIGQGKVNVAAGTINLNAIELSNGRYQTQVQAVNVPVQQLAQVPPQFRGNFTGRINVGGSVDSFDLKNIIAVGRGRVNVAAGLIHLPNIQLANGRYETDVIVNNVPLRQLAQVPPQFNGNFTGGLNVRGGVDSFDLRNITVVGRGRVNVAAGLIDLPNIQLANGRYETDVIVNNVPLRQLAQVPPQFNGNFTGGLNVRGGVNSFDLRNVTVIGRGRVNVAAGLIDLPSIQLANGRYETDVIANNVPLRQLAQVPPQFNGNFTGKFNVKGGVNSFSLRNITASGGGNINVEAGTISLPNIKLANGSYSAGVIANNIALEQLAEVPEKFRGVVSGNLNVTGSVDSFGNVSINATGKTEASVAGGKITAENIFLQKGRFSANVDAEGIDLNSVNQQLQGEFGGKLQVAGRLGSANIGSLFADGDVTLSRGIPGIEEPLAASINWNGKKLTIRQANSENLSVDGDIFARMSRSGIPEITQLNLNVHRANNFNLQKLPLSLPQNVKLAGLFDYTGKITGNLPAPNLNGKVTLRGLEVNQFKFEPVLAGTIDSARGRNFSLNVAGNQDLIKLDLDGNNSPIDFAVKWQQAYEVKLEDGKSQVSSRQISINGEKKGEIFDIGLGNFPISLVKPALPENFRMATGNLDGLVSGNLKVNPNTFAANGNLDIVEPRIGLLTGDKLTAKFNYANKRADNIESTLTKGQSTYNFKGNFAQTGQNPQISGNLNVKKGEIQDILAAVQLFNFQDVQSFAGFSNNVITDCIKSNCKEILSTEANGSINRNVSRLEEVAKVTNTLTLQEQKRRSTWPLPDLGDLKGTFDGDVEVSTAKGLNINFKLDGEQFTWGKTLGIPESEKSYFVWREQQEQPPSFNAEKVNIQGQLENNILRVEKFQIESKDKKIEFAGTLGGDDQSGQLRVVNFPASVLNNFVDFPIALTGRVNGRAFISGSISNPRSIGQFDLIGGKLRDKDIQSATASFSYADGRLNFGSNIAIAAASPMIITAEIPYKLPFANVLPASDNILLKVNVENEGLALLGLLTNQSVNFEGGQGKVELTATGTSDKPIVKGSAEVANATFSARFLDEKELLTNVNGKIDFDLDRARISQEIQGRFRRGLVTAVGEIPIFNDKLEVEKPIDITLKNLALNLRSLYRGGASGDLRITGSALTPKIGGDIELSDGQVLLAESSNSSGSNTNDGIRITPLEILTKSNKIAFQTQNQSDSSPNAENQPQASLNNLALKLGKNVYITLPPILNFRAQGELAVNGLLSDPVPVGTIELKDGAVNLFTTQFNLARGRKNIATFRENEPRNPELDIRLFAKVLDTIQSVDIERPDATGLTTLESVRVEASIEGFASNINESLKLTSVPSRSEPQLVALLGGGFTDTQGRGNDSTLGLINIAGSAVFNNFNTAFAQLGNALGVSEFRIFPTIISENPEAGRNSSSLEIAAEAAVDISPKISLSVLSILTAGDPVQFGLNYRINNEFRLRSSTNFVNDNRAVIEFERRF